MALENNQNQVETEGDENFQIRVVHWTALHLKEFFLQGTVWLETKQWLEMSRDGVGGG